MYPFQNLNSLTFILKSFLFLAGTRLRIGEKGEKKNGVDMAKKKNNNKNSRGVVWRGERLVLKKLFLCRGPTGQERALNLKNICGGGGKG